MMQNEWIDCAREMKETMNHLGISQRKLAKMLNVSDVCISYFYRGITELSLNKYAEMLEIAFPNKVSERNQRILKYLKATPKNKKNRRIAMDYCTNYGDWETALSIIKTEKNSSSKENQEYAEVYELILKYEDGKLNSAQWYNDLTKLRKEIKSKYMIILIDILLCKAKYVNDDCSTLFERMLILEEQLLEITDEYWKCSFQMRIKEGLAAIYLLDKQVDETRLICDELLKLCTSNIHLYMTKARALWLKAESYFFTDYERARSLFEMALSVLNRDLNYEMTKKRELIVDTLSSLKIHWMKDLDSLPSNLNFEEEVFLAVKTGNGEKAIYLLNQYKEKGNELSAFLWYCWGLADKENSDVYIKRALELYEKKYDLFYVQFVKEQLEISKYSVK